MLALLQEKETRKARNRLRDYVPYPKQAKFHRLGAKFKERLLLASNRFGKSEAGAFEGAIHLTGQYPDWWDGKVFDGPVRMWASGVTSLSTRDVPQEKLIGDPASKKLWGTGTIPYDCIDFDSITMGRGVAHAIDMVSIKHVTGGYSTLGFKSYEVGREKWQGTAREVIWFDEEPPEDIYLEGITRTAETGGIVYLTCTPLLGRTAVINRFLSTDG